MKKRIITVLTVLLLICAFTAAASAEATLSASTLTPVTGQQISFTVGTTQQGLDAIINTDGLSYVSNTGLGNSNHVITVPGMGTTYTYTVTAQPGETVAFILSDVNESDADGNEMPGQRAVWMATAVAQEEPPSSSPTTDPTTDPTNPPTDEPSGNPTTDPGTSPSPGTNPPTDPGTQATPTPPPAGNPSPTVNPGTSQDGNNTQNTGNGSAGTITTGGGTTGGTGGSAGGSGTSGSGGAPPKTGDLTHFLALLGVIGALLLIIVIAGRKVFAEE